MAYFRGENYIWSDGDDLHLWSREGMDNWNDTWIFDESGKRIPGYENASGVAISEDIIDQFVMMRLAEILVHSPPEHIEKLIDKASEVGHFGSDCLRRNQEALKETLLSLRFVAPERG